LGVLRAVRSEHGALDALGEVEAGLGEERDVRAVGREVTLVGLLAPERELDHWSVLVVAQGFELRDDLVAQSLELRRIDDASRLAPFDVEPDRASAGRREVGARLGPVDVRFDLFEGLSRAR